MTYNDHYCKLAANWIIERGGRELPTFLLQVCRSARHPIALFLVLSCRIIRIMLNNNDLRQYYNKSPCVLRAVAHDLALAARPGQQLRCAQFSLYSTGDSGSENPASAIGAFSPVNCADCFGLRSEDIPSFQACTMFFATFRQRGSFFAASITSLPTTTTDSQSRSTISAY